MGAVAFFRQVRTDKGRIPDAFALKGCGFLCKYSIYREEIKRFLKMLLSLPLRGAWVEILKVIDNNGREEVAPLAGSVG